MNSQNIKRTRIILPIITSLFAIAIIVGLIYLFATKRIELPLFIVGLLVALVAPVMSWFSNVFIGRYTDQKYQNFEEETKKMVNYASTLKGYSTLDLAVENPIKLEIEETDELKELKIIYDYQEVVINKMIIKGVFITFGVTICGLVIDQEGLIQNVSGFLPSTTWTHKNLLMPEGTKCSLKISGINLFERKVYKAVSKAETYFDKNSHIICIGTTKIKDSDQVYNIYQNVAVVVNDNHFKALYIRLTDEKI